MTRMEANGINGAVIAIYFLLPVLLFIFAPFIAKLVIPAHQEESGPIVLETQTFMQAGLALIGVGMMAFCLMNIGFYLPDVFKNFAEGANSHVADLSIRFGYLFQELMRNLAGVGIGVGLIIWSKLIARKLLK